MKERKCFEVINFYVSLRAHFYFPLPALDGMSGNDVLSKSCWFGQVALPKEGTSCLFSKPPMHGWCHRSRDRRGRMGDKISKHQLWHHKDGWATWHVVLVSEYHQLGPQQAQSRSNWTAVEATVTPSTPRPIALPHSIKHQLRQTVLASFFDDFTIDYRLIIEKSLNTEREKRKQMAWKPARWLASRFVCFAKMRWKRGGGNPLNHLFCVWRL